MFSTKIIKNLWFSSFSVVINKSHHFYPKDYFFLFCHISLKTIFVIKIMRDSQSSDRKYPRGFNRISMKGSLQPDNYFLRQSNKSSESEAKILEEFYFSQMFRIFQSADKRIPDPVKLIEGIRAKELRLTEMGHQCQELKLKLKTLSQIHSKYQIPSKNLGQIQMASGVKPENKEKLPLQSCGQNSHLLLVHFLKSFTPTKEEEVVKFSQISNKNILEEFLRLIRQGFKTLQKQIQSSKQSSETKLSRVKSEEKFHKNTFEQIQASTRHRKKLDELIAQLDQSIEIRKSLEKENKELHMNMLRANTTIVSKNERIEQLSRKLDQLTKQKMTAQKSEDEIGILKDENEELKAKNIKISEEKQEVLCRLKQLKEEFEKIEKKSVTPRKKVRQSMSFYTSKDNEQEDNPKNSRQKQEELYENIRILQFKNKILQEDHRKEKKQLQEKDRLKLEGMVEQWRDYLKINIEEMNVQLGKKDRIICELREELSRKQQAH